MAQATSRITREILSEPHIVGRRISVLQIHELVEEADASPEVVAERYDLDLADVYHALAYYHDHGEEMRRVEQTRNETFERFQERIDERPP